MRNGEKILRRHLDPPKGTPGLVRLTDRRGIETEMEDRLEKAQEDLRAARLMHGRELYGWTVVCSYYAMYHAVLAAVVQQGLRAKNHSAAADALEILYTRRSELSPDFARQFRKARRLEREYVDSLREIRERRERAQYEVFRPGNDDADEALRRAEEFVIRIEEALA